jgi:hypothetical protein
MKSLDQDQIKVAGSSEAYEVEVARIVTDMILSSVTGRAVATKIKAHGEVLITDDYPGIDSRDINSEFDPGRSSKNLGIVGFHPHNRHLNTVRVQLNGRPITGSQLNFVHKHSPGMKPDEVLCHELLHAARYLGGDFSKIPIPSMPGYEDEEEYFAILVTNIYSSEKGRTFESFRKSHHIRYEPEMNRFEALPLMFALEDDNLRLIAKFCRQHPVIAPMIARATAQFNPVRDYYVLANSS